MWRQRSPGPVSGSNGAEYRPRSAFGQSRPRGGREEHEPPVNGFASSADTLNGHEPGAELSPADRTVRRPTPPGRKRCGSRAETSECSQRLQSTILDGPRRAQLRFSEPPPPVAREARPPTLTEALTRSVHGRRTPSVTKSLSGTSTSRPPRAISRACFRRPERSRRSSSRSTATPADRADSPSSSSPMRTALPTRSRSSTATTSTDGNSVSTRRRSARPVHRWAPVEALPRSKAEAVRPSPRAAAATSGARSGASEEVDFSEAAPGRGPVISGPRPESVAQPRARP